jgi:hypothetical protein
LGFCSREECFVSPVQWSEGRVPQGGIPSQCHWKQEKRKTELDENEKGSRWWGWGRGWGKGKDSRERKDKVHRIVESGESAQVSFLCCCVAIEKDE